MAIKKFYHDIDLVNIGQLIGARIQNVTNAEKTALAGDLDVNHKGLQVWDTQDNAPYIWDGTAFVRDALVVNGDVIFRGSVDASASLNGVADAVAGNQYVVSVGGTPSMTGVTFTPANTAVEPGDIILFTSDTAATILQRNLQDAIVDSDFGSEGLMTTDGSGNYTITTNNSANWDTAFSWGDHSTQGYLTSESNDLTASVTWANVPDANITESSVTQHQAALSITESQISDLGSYLTSESNDLTASVTWANVPDANITESSVTQHQGALSITESQISDLGSYLTSVALNDVSDVTITAAATGEFLRYNGTAWVDSTIQDGDIAESAVTQHQGALSITESQISDLGSYAALTDLSIGTDATASGSGGIEYDDQTGVFTYTPPDLSGITTNANAIGTLGSLTTSNKSDLVTAINEVRGAIPQTYFNGAVTLTADTAVTINHGFNLTNPNSYILNVADSNGSSVSVDVDTVDGNNITLTSSLLLENIKVAIIGFDA